MDDDTQLVVFRLDGKRYGLRLRQTERVERAVDYMPLPDAPAVVIGVIDVRGEVVPVLTVRERFGLPPRPVGVDDHFILANALNRRVAIVVDAVDGIFNRPVGGNGVVAGEAILPGLGHLDGVMPLEDGLTLIYDLDRFLSAEEGRSLDAALVGHREHGR